MSWNDLAQPPDHGSPCAGMRWNELDPPIDRSQFRLLKLKLERGDKTLNVVWKIYGRKELKLERGDIQLNTVRKS